MKKVTFKLFSLMLAVVLILLCSACRSSEPTSGKVPSNTETESKEPVKLVYTADAFSEKTLSDQEQTFHLIGWASPFDYVKLEKTDPYYREKVSVTLGTGVVEGDGSCEFKYKRTIINNWLGIKSSNWYTAKEGWVYIDTQTVAVKSLMLEPRFFKKPYEQEIDEAKAEELAKRYFSDLGLTEFANDIPQGYVLKVEPCTSNFDYNKWSVIITAKSGDREILEVAKIHLDTYGRLTLYKRHETYDLADPLEFPNYSETEVLAIARQKFDEVCVANNFDAEDCELEFWIHDYYLVDGELVPCVFYQTTAKRGENDIYGQQISIRILIQTE